MSPTVPPAPQAGPRAPHQWAPLPSGFWWLKGGTDSRSEGVSKVRSGHLFYQQSHKVQATSSQLSLSLGVPGTPPALTPQGKDRALFPGFPDSCPAPGQQSPQESPLNLEVVPLFRSPPRTVTGSSQIKHISLLPSLNLNIFLCAIFPILGEELQG